MNLDVQDIEMFEPAAVPSTSSASERNAVPSTSGASEPQSVQSTTGASEAKKKKKEPKPYAPNTYLLGQPCLFSGQKLPTRSDVLRRLLLEFNESKSKQVSLHSFRIKVGEEITEIWQKTKIPIIRNKTMLNKISRLIEEYKKQSKRKHRDALDNFAKQSDVLFDIAQCRCLKNKCNCSVSSKIPKEFIEFIIDQRGQRRCTFTAQESPGAPSEIDFHSDADADIPESRSASEYIPSANTSRTLTRDDEVIRHYAPRRHLKNVAMECDRFKSSNRLAAALVFLYMRYAFSD